MKQRALLGIDLGTTMLKVAAFDEQSGTLLGRACRILSVSTSPEGFREQHLDMLDQSLRQTVAELREKLGSTWDAIEGIGIAAQGGSTILAKRASGRPLTPMILWNDARGYEQTERVMEQFPTSFWRAFTLRDAPPAGLGRLLWLQEHQPELFSPEIIHIGAGEYLFHRLTGIWRQEAGNAIQIGTYNAAEKCLDGAAIAFLDLPLDFVAPLRDGHETASLSSMGDELLQLGEGVRVAGPYIDQEAGYLAVAAAHPASLQLSLGTAWVGNFTLPEDRKGGSPFQLVLPSPTGPGSLIVQPLLTGNTGWDWALNQFVEPGEGDLFRAAAALFEEALLPPRGLCAIPWFAQPNPLIADAHGGACFWGVGPQTTQGDLLRAVAAGMSYETTRVFSEVTGTEAVNAVVLTGGGRNAPCFRRLLADLFTPLPTYFEEDDDLAVARGALYAFGGPSCESRLGLIKPDSFSNRIQDEYDGYLAVFNKLYGTVSNGRPFRVEGK